MIPLMDVRRQYETISHELLPVVEHVLASGNYIMGKDVEKFESEFATFLGINYGIAVGNGTDALVIALRALGIQPGDEVITTAMSFFATSEAISRVGAVPVFADCSREYFTLMPKDVEAKITQKTKAIIPVHLYGQCADMTALKNLADKYHLYIVEDAAQAAGASYKEKKAGTYGDISCFSFFPTKNLGCAGDGGIIVTNSEDLAKKCRAYRVHGSGEEGKFTFENQNTVRVNEDFGSNLPKYFNYIIGYNSRMDTIQAAILRVKLRYLEQWNKQRNEIAKRYSEKISNPNILCPICGENNYHIYYVYVVCTEDSITFRKYMHDNGIATGIYFPVPLHLQTVYRYLGYKPGDMPNAEFISKHSVAIPIFPELTKEEQDYVIKVINRY